VSESLAGRRSTHTVSSGHPVIGFQQGSSQGLAANAVELVDYATRAAALTPAFVPGPRDWMYRDLQQKIGPHRNREVTWFEVDLHHMFVLDHGKLSSAGGSKGGCGGQVGGWPGCFSNLYRYWQRFRPNQPRFGTSSWRTTTPSPPRRSAPSWA